MAGLNEALLARAAGQKLLRTARVRADTTVIGANVAYPTDAGLLAKAVGKLVRAARRVQAAGGATGTVMTDRRRAAGRRAREMAATMRARAQLGRDESSRAIRRVTGDLADLAEGAAAQAAAVLRNGRRAIPKALSGRMRGRLRRALGELAVTIERTATVAAQARSRLAGQMPDGATRLVSLHDPDARPIRKGRIDKPVEFGYKAQVIDNDDGVILDYGVQAGNPPDAPQLAPAISRIARRAGRTPRSVTADRGYGEPATERDLQALGIRTVAIPRRARPSSRPPRRRACPRLPHARQVANRLRRPDQLPQTPIRLGPHPAGRPPRSFHLVRARGIQPQPGQDQRPCQLTRPARTRECRQYRGPRSAFGLFQVEVI